MRFLFVDGLSQGNPNNNSLVMRLDLGPVRVLFMGDAEGGERANWEDGTPEAGTIEATLLACCPSEIDSDVLIVGHHGSKTSSRTAFLDAVSASTFVVSSGPTKYGSVVLPDPEVIAALTARGAVLRTDLDDSACRTSSEKVGDDADGRAGGCSNIRLTIGPGSSVVGSIWVGDEEID
jgi:competence protein ComEC